MIYQCNQWFLNTITNWLTVMKYANSQMAMDLLSGFFVFFPLSPRRVLLVLTMNNSAGVIRKGTCLPFGTPVVKESVLLVCLYVSVVFLFHFVYCTLYCTCIWIVHFLFQFWFSVAYIYLKRIISIVYLIASKQSSKLTTVVMASHLTKLFLLKKKTALIWLHIEIIRALLKTEAGCGEIPCVSHLILFLSLLS